MVGGLGGLNNGLQERRLLWITAPFRDYHALYLIRWGNFVKIARSDQ